MDRLRYVGRTLSGKEIYLMFGYDEDILSTHTLAILSPRKFFYIPYDFQSDTLVYTRKTSNRDRYSPIPGFLFVIPLYEGRTVPFPSLATAEEIEEHLGR